MQVIFMLIREIYERQIPRLLKGGLKVNLNDPPEIFADI
jgi:hypothetical protein